MGGWKSKTEIILVLACLYSCLTSKVESSYDAGIASSRLTTGSMFDITPDSK